MFKKTGKNLLLTRPQLSTKEFYSKYYCHEEISFDMIARCLELLEKVLGFNMNGILPTDRLAYEIEGGWDSLWDAEFVTALEEGFSISISPEEARAIKTVDDLFRFVKAKINA